MTSLLFRVALIIAVSISSISFAATLPDLKGRTILAVTENAYTPLNFVDADTGKGIGWEYDAMNEIGKRLNAKIEWHLSSWDTMIQAVKQNQYDIGMDGITINEERAQQIDFSIPYMTAQQFMLVRADEERFQDAESFAANDDFQFGAQAGTTNFYVAVYNVLDGDENNSRITLLETFGASVQALKSGDVDSVLMDSASARGYIGANPGQFKVIGGPLGSEDFGFILTPDSDLLKPVNAAIESMRKDGTLEALNKKWFFDYNQ
ncbi:transporter substrate-binding domain-containing protein [Marinomonas colpomeniae]|jgi:polar amino acid transport system substrate-binding protein|uniref:Transporter substrate-binding domain-containing protein n=1 Tax=Marinomonas colpomeniae TaxID=2774408 RepID=A0ABR8P4G2_9GAMM|nr:transporter substrate-binding domain-containing protein [Marinomonas colpomeniae]MBD5772719.1 transporter substrate-binding domain-containing protein [Marinomonas colpomeniae]